MASVSGMHASQTQTIYARVSCFASRSPTHVVVDGTLELGSASLGLERRQQTRAGMQEAPSGPAPRPTRDRRIGCSEARGVPCERSNALHCSLYS
jgi:hypothetical protein